MLLTDSNEIMILERADVDGILFVKNVGLWIIFESHYKQ